MNINVNKKDFSSINSMLPDEQIETYKEAFSIYDKNGDSKITLDEFGEVMKSLGLNPNPEQLKMLMREIDLDNNGSVDFSEFVIWMSIKMSPQIIDRERELEDTFKIFDENGDHFITAQELQSVMNRLGQSLTEEEINMMIQSADTDKDKRINFKEFVQLMRQLDV